MINNIVVMLIDALRFDSLSYNRKHFLNSTNDTPKTPNLDKFATRGDSFSRTYSTNTYTTSAIASLLTGDLPFTHGIRSFFDFNQTLNPKLTTLPEVFNEKGYQTFFYSDVPVLFETMNIWKGFNIKTQTSTSNLWEAIRKNKKARNLLFIHLFDIHSPYLFIKDAAASGQENEEYYDMIGTIRKRLHLKSKLHPIQNPYESFNELVLFMTEHKLNQNEILKPFYDQGVKLFDSNRLPYLLDRLDSVGILEQDTVYLLLSDHGEGATALDSQFGFSHRGELTESVLKIPVIFSKKTNISDDLLSITNLKQLLTDFIDSKNSHFDNEYVYAEHFQSPQRILQVLKDKEYGNQANSLNIKPYLFQNSLIFEKTKMIFNNLLAINEDHTVIFPNRKTIEVYGRNGLWDIPNENCTKVISNFYGKMDCSTENQAIKRLQKKNALLTNKLSKIYTSKMWRSLSIYKKVEKTLQNLLSR